MAGEVAYRPTEADFRLAQHEAAIRRIRDPRSLRTMALVIGLVVAVKFTIDSLDRPVGEAASLAVRFGLAALIVFVVTWLADYVWSRARARRMCWPATSRPDRSSPLLRRPRARWQPSRSTRAWCLTRES